MTRPAVVKTVYTVTVFSPADQAPNPAMELGDVIYEITEGSWIGSIERAEPEPVADKDVPSALCAIGNDGTFFDVED